MAQLFGNIVVCAGMAILALAIWDLHKAFKDGEDDR